MASHRALKEVTFLVVLVSLADGIQNEAGNKHLNVVGPFALVKNHLDYLKGRFPVERDYLKFLNSTQKVVNAWLPLSRQWWTPEMKFWFAGQVAMRLVSSGWRPTGEQYMKEFVQELYNVGLTFKTKKPPSDALLALLMQSPETLRGTYGMFLPSC